MERCPRCLLQQRVCLCGSIPVVPTRTHVVIVRHHLEIHRSSNSGRLAHLALPNSEIIDHGGSGGPAKLGAREGAWLLFPEGEARTVPPEPPPKQLIVLDATWAQARRMYRKLGDLRGVPILRLPEGLRAGQARLRTAPTPDRVSTIEAIAAALRLLEGDAVATPLETLFELAVERVRSLGRSLK